MLSERTADLVRLFKEGEEVIYFGGEAELIEKTTALLHDLVRGERIAKAALLRVWTNEYDALSRMQQTLIYATSSDDIYQESIG